MNISPSGIYPEMMFKSKVLLQCSVDDVYGHRHEGPALRTHVCTTTVSPHIVIVCHVKVKHQFFFLSLESSQMHCIVLIWSVGVY